MLRMKVAAGESPRPSRGHSQALENINMQNNVSYTFMYINHFINVRYRPYIDLRVSTVDCVLFILAVGLEAVELKM